MLVVLGLEHCVRSGYRYPHRGDFSRCPLLPSKQCGCPELPLQAMPRGRSVCQAMVQSSHLPNFVGVVIRCCWNNLCDCCNHDGASVNRRLYRYLDRRVDLGGSCVVSKLGNGSCDKGQVLGSLRLGRVELLIERVLDDGAFTQAPVKIDGKTAANRNASDKRWRWITMTLVIGCRRCASATAFVPASLEPRSGNHEYNTLVVHTVKNSTLWRVANHAAHARAAASAIWQPTKFPCASSKTRCCLKQGAA
jgi:hypothetical protein